MKLWAPFSRSRLGSTLEPEDILEQVKEWVGNEEMQRGKYMQPFPEVASQVKGWYVILRGEGMVEKLY